MSSKIFVKIHAVLRNLWSCAQLPMCPIGHVPHPPRYPISIFNINHDTPLPMCPIAHMSYCPYVKKYVKLSKRCQMSNSQTHGLWRRFTKKINSHNEVHTYWCEFRCYIWWWPKILKMCIKSVFEQFWWPSYLTSKLTSICVNLIMWICCFFCEPLCVWLFRWFKFTLKPPYTVAHGNLSSAIWDTSHWTSFVKFGLKTAWDISYYILWPILKYVNFWRLQGCSSNLSKKDAFRKSIFFSMKEQQGFEEAWGGFGWAGPQAIWWYHFWGGVTHLGCPTGHLAQKFRFLDTFAAA